MPDASLFTGEFGGALALAFGGGCVSGWAFAMRMLGARISELKHDIDRERADCDRRIAALDLRLKAQDDRIQQIEDRSYHGQANQLAQVRDSGLRIIRDGQIIRQEEDE